MWLNVHIRPGVPLEKLACQLPEELTSKERALAVYLRDRAGTPVSRGELLQAVWGLSEHTRTRTVDVTIAKLRRKLGSEGIVQSVAGVGYVWTSLQLFT